MASNTINLNTYRAKLLSNSYGSTTKPIYINDGVPTILGTIGGQYEPVWVDSGVIKAITAGTTAQFYRGDKTWSNTLTGVLILDTGAVNGQVLKIMGADNKTFSFKLSGDSVAGSNVDIGWDWTAVEGAGAAFRSTSFPSQEGEFRIFARKKNSSNTAVYTQLIGTAGETTNGGTLTWGENVIPTTGNNSGNVGGTTGPVYINNGVITACTTYANATVGAANKLATARAINGTDFDGTAAITTANWGTARTLTIGATGKSVNGSANVSWSMDEIMGASDNTKFYRGDKSWSNTLGGAFTANGTITANGGYLKSTLNGNTVTIGSANTSWCHISNSADISFYFNKSVHVDGDVYRYNTKVHMSSSGFHPPKNGGIYWDPYVESASDASDVTQIIQVAGGVAGGTELRIQQANDSNDVINLVSPYYIYLNSKCAFQINDAWLRINEGGGFSSGVYFGSSVVRTDGELWSDQIRLVDNWVGFYNAVQGSTRYGYVQANADRMYFVKENSTASLSYYFSFNARVYTPTLSVGYENTSYTLSATNAILNGNLVFTNSGTGFRGINYGTMGDNDQWRIGGAATASNAGYMEIATADDGNEPIYVRQYTGVFGTLIRTAILLDENGYTQFPSRVGIGMSPSYNLDINGNVRASGEFYTSNNSFYARWHFIQWYNNAWWTTIWNHDNGNIALQACGGGLYIGYTNTSELWLYSNSNWKGKVDTYHTLLLSRNPAADPYTGAAIEIREVNEVTNTQDSEAYAPKLGFHWGNRTSAYLALLSDGWFKFGHGVNNYYSLRVNSLNAAGEVYCGGWLRTYNSTGWYNETYGGGIYMSDGTWVRIYNSKGLHVDNTIEVAVNGYPSVRLQRTDAGEVSQYFINNTAGWAIGINPWGIGAGQFGIGQYSGTGSSTWRLRIDNNGYVYTSSYINLGGGNENNASSPPRVLGFNGSDNFVRSYQTHYLRAGYLDGWDSNPNNSHPGYGARVFYSWNIGQAFNDSAGYSNGITIGSHPGDQAYGFQIVQNMWNDTTYTRRYNGGWQSWRTLMNCEDAQTVTNYKVFTSTGSNRATLYLRSAANVPNDFWFGSNNSDKWSITCRASDESHFLGFYSATNGTWRMRLYHDGNNYCDGEWHVSGWVRFANWTGLYSPNNGAHFYPNNSTSYGAWQMQGTRGGYYGLVVGPGQQFIHLMDNGSDKGLYEQDQRWILYYSSSSQRIGLMSADVSSGYSVQVNGSLYVTSNTYIPNTIYSDSTAYVASLWANRGSPSERQVGVDYGTAGNLYLWSNSGEKGLYSGSGYKTGYVIQINSAGRYFYPNSILIDTTISSAAASQPTALSYGRLQAYGTLWINANTDNSGDEYVCLTAGHGVSSTLTDGFWVGSSSVGTSLNTRISHRLDIFPGSNSNWGEGIRIHSATNGWTTLCLCGTDNTGDGGTSANSYSLHTYAGNFYIARNGSSSGSSLLYCLTDNYWRCSTRIYGAVWNDYAEYRQGEITEGGRVVYDDNTGIMKITTKRMQAAARIISDTFGFAVGESETAHTPIGVGGRVLAFPYQNRTNYHVGDAVCAAPNGTIDIMTREEIIEYPDRIIGIVSEIPQYNIWINELANGGRGRAEIKVNGRIWIYVR